MKIVISSVVVILIFLGFILFIGKANTPYSNNQLSGLKLETLVNNWRTQKNLSPLINNQQLCDVAKIRAQDIQTDYSHDKFNDRMQGLKGMYVAENLSTAFASETDTLNAWIASPEHVVNLENPKYTKQCIVCEENFCAQELASDPSVN